MMVFHKQTFTELLQQAAYAIDVLDSVKCESVLVAMQERLVGAYTKAERADLLKHAYEATTDYDNDYETIQGAWAIIDIIEDRIGVDI